MSAVTYSVPSGSFATHRVAERPVDYGRGDSTDIGPSLVQAIAGAALAQARLLEVKGSLLHQLKNSRGHEKLGFHFGDFAREILKMDPRMARNRIALFEVLESRPAVRKAFLEGRASGCQILAIRRVLTDENEAFWIEACASLTVSELVDRVRKTATSSDISRQVEDLDESWTISFAAASVARLAWERSMETARKVLGWEAPTYLCVEAVLAEAAPGACSNEPLRPPRRSGPRAATGKPASECPAVEPLPRASERSLERALETLAQVSDMLGDLNDLIDDRPADKPEQIVDRLLNLRVLDRPLRVFLGRLLRDLKETGALYRLGYLRLEEFSEFHLHLSERTTRDLVRECEVFAECPALEEAFARGRIGLRQALLIERHALRGHVEAFIARAEVVTCRQFSREMRLVEKFGDLGLGRYARPFPQRGVLAGLAQVLIDRGWSANGLAAELGSRGFDAHAAWLQAGRTRACPFDDDDPAITSLGPIEILVDLLVLLSFDSDDPRTSDLRQTFSAGNRSPRPSRVRFRAPEPIARHWFGAIREIWLEQGGLLPTWACVMLLLKRAVDVWSANDPDTTPTQRKILERDGYLCQAPGCSSRRNLEVHHISFRSRGGGNEASNRLTLCHAHHAHMIHAGHVRVNGTAPHALRWEIGRFRSGEPFLRVNGERIT